MDEPEEQSATSPMSPVALSRVAFANFGGMLVILGAVATLYGPLLISLSRHFHISLRSSRHSLERPLRRCPARRPCGLDRDGPREGKRRFDRDPGVLRSGRTRRRARLVVAGVLGGSLCHWLRLRRAGLRDQHAARAHCRVGARSSTQRGECRVRAWCGSWTTARRSRRASQLSVSLWRRGRRRRHPFHDEPRNRRARADRRRPPSRTQLSASTSSSDPRDLYRRLRPLRGCRVERVGMDRPATPSRRALRVTGRVDHGGLLARTHARSNWWRSLAPALRRSILGAWIARRWRHLAASRLQHRRRARRLPSPRASVRLGLSDGLSGTRACVRTIETAWLSSFCA